MEKSEYKGSETMRTLTLVPKVVKKKKTEDRTRNMWFICLCPSTFVVETEENKDKVIPQLLSKF